MTAIRNLYEVGVGPDGEENLPRSELEELLRAEKDWSYYWEAPWELKLAAERKIRRFWRGVWEEDEGDGLETGPDGKPLNKWQIESAFWVQSGEMDEVLLAGGEGREQTAAASSSSAVSSSAPSEGQGAAASCAGREETLRPAAEEILDCSSAAGTALDLAQRRAAENTIWRRVPDCCHVLLGDPRANPRFEVLFCQERVTGRYRGRKFRRINWFFGFLACTILPLGALSVIKNMRHSRKIKVTEDMIRKNKDVGCFVFLS